MIFIAQKAIFPICHVEPIQPNPYDTTELIPAMRDGMLIARVTATKKQNGFVHSCEIPSARIVQHSPQHSPSILQGTVRHLHRPSQAVAHPLHNTAAILDIAI